MGASQRQKGKINRFDLLKRRAVIVFLSEEL